MALIILNVAFWTWLYIAGFKLDVVIIKNPAARLGFKYMQLKINAFAYGSFRCGSFASLARFSLRLLHSRLAVVYPSLL